MSESTPLLATVDDFRRAAERKNLKARPVDVDLFGDGTLRRVWVRVLTAGESLEYHRRNFGGLTPGEKPLPGVIDAALVDLVVCTVCGEDRERLFPADATWLLDLDDRALGKIAAAAREINRLTTESRGELAKNSSPAVASDSPPA